MPELFTSPSTGQQRMIETRYDGGMDAIDPQAIARAYQTQKVEDAEKAVAQAIQFQGLRGYQQALQSGDSSQKALTRYGPMMFYQRPSAFGSAMRAVTPPQMTPFQQATIDERKSRAVQPMIRSVPGGGFVSINPTNQAVKTIREPTADQDKRTFSAVVDPGRRSTRTPPSRVPMTKTEFESFIAGAPPQLRTNAVNAAIQGMVQPSATGTNAPTKTKRLRYNPKTGEFE